MSKQTTALERDLAAAMTRRDALEQRRELLAGEHGAAVTAQRAVWLGSEGDNLKVLDKMDARVAAAESSLRATEAGLAAVRERIVQLNNDLTVQRDIEQREALAVALEKIVPELDASFADLKAAVTKFVAVLDSSTVPEAIALKNWTTEFFTPVAAEVPRVCTLHADAARVARNTSTLPPKPQPLPVPVLRPQLRDSGRPDTSFVDWSAAR